MERAPKPRQGKFPPFYKGIPVSVARVNANLNDQWIVCDPDTINRFACPARMLVAGPSGAYVCLFDNVISK